MKATSRRSQAVRAGLLVTLTFAAMAATPARAQLFRGSPVAASECYRDDLGGKRRQMDTMTYQLEALQPTPLSSSDISLLQGIASSCATAAGQQRATRQQTLYANFFAGKAERLIGSSDSLTAAERHLRDVVEFNGARAGARSPQPDLRFELTRIEAEVELARVHRGLRQRDDAVRYAESAIRRYEAYETNIATFRPEAFQGRVNANLALANIHRTVAPINEVAALIRLDIFISQNLDEDRNARDARLMIMQTANAEGERTLTEALQRKDAGLIERAANLFKQAERAGVAARRKDPSISMTATRVNLGRAMLASIGREGPDAVNGCAPAPLNSGLAADAQRLFAEEGSSADALRWKGCAEMIAGTPDTALGSFKRAAELGGQNAYKAYMSLGRAFYTAATSETYSVANAWGQARDAYRSARQQLNSANPSRSPDSKALGVASWELAQVDLDYLKKSAVVEPSRAAVLNEAYAALEQAVQLEPTWPEPRLKLGRIQVGDGDYAGKAAHGSARTNLAQVIKDSQAPERRALRAEANYWLSYLETHRRKQGLAADAEAAVTHGEAAATISGEREHFGQACEARLVFRGYARGDGTRFCIASPERDGDQLTYALLREGIWHLTRTTRGRNGRDAAFAAFERGLAEAAKSAQVNPELQGRLQAGKGIAMICSGLEGAGEQLINQFPEAQRARTYFEGYGIVVNGLVVCR